jgi:hypothetical protein
MATILEALQNAQYNLATVRETRKYKLLPLAEDQLQNATVLLSKGYNVEDEIEPLLEKYGTVENVPDLDFED